jgi:hypothetical protein|tara:strand:+ start:563 stop:709 length:147 start_codon:yes stop_codon:yes gene_type:complete
MKLSKAARTKKKLANASEMKKVVSAAKTLFDFGLISSKRADMIARNYR